MLETPNLRIYVFDEVILIKNKNGKIKEFPRCNITHVEPFVLEMAQNGKLDDLLNE